MKSSKSAKINNRKDILLLLLYTPGKTNQFGESITGRTRLVKMLFLFKKEIYSRFKSGLEVPDANFYNFIAWHYGPFSRDVYDDLTFFLLHGFIESKFSSEESDPEAAMEWEEWAEETGVESTDETGFEYQDEVFSLTEKGIRFAKDLYDQLNNSQKQALKEFKTRTNFIPLRALLVYVYKNYPESTEKSTIKEEVLGNAN